MKQIKKNLLLFSFLLVASVGFSQKDYSISFQNQKIEIQENANSFDWNGSESYNGGFYLWMQFYSTPIQTVQDELNTHGVKFLEYISNSTYLAFVPNSISKNILGENGVRGMISVPKEVKTTATLLNGDMDNWAVDGNRVLLDLMVYDNVSLESIVSNLESKNIQIVEKNKGANIATVSVLQSEIQNLLELEYLQWVEQIPAPGEKEDNRGRNLHRSNNLDTQTSAGRNYTGDGIGVLVRDDGIVGPHIDFQGRLDNSGASNSGPTHGDGVAGILAGAGNLDPLMRGMAAGSDVYVSNYASNFLDGTTTTLINSGDVQITNSSYSDGCNSGYTTRTQTVDQQTKTIPTLLHVFSAGNNGASNCTNSYGAGSTWGNITGGHKQGKNVIATANVFFDGSLVNSSSRGPAYDGRIKPDIAANGQNQNSTDEDNTYMSFGGTSGASPGIAGVSAQLYEAYGNANAGALPQSALIKATLLNTANDYGNVGPDYKFGWGIVNGLRAAKLIEDNSYLSSTVSQGISNSHNITVPAGTKQVRFMVYWSDPAASPGATTCLINDLDLTVTNPASATLLPWILDPTPNPTTLNLPATNGADHLNNMEQVLVNNPAAGTYVINISGFNVPFGPQEYFIVYEIIEENVTVTYPNMGESFVPGETESLHWDAVNTTGTFTLEYSTNNGSTWNNIATVGSTVTNYAWTIPNTVTGSAKFRVTNGSNIDVSDGVFSIAPLVTGQQLTKMCPDSATFTWNAVMNASVYDLYVLGVKYMEVAGTSPTLSVTIPISNPLAPIWYAVVARNTTLNWESRRSIASFYPGGLLNCSLPNDLAMASINNPIGDFSAACNGGTNALISVTINNTGLNSQSNFPVSYQVNSNTPVVETFTGTITSGQQATYTFTTPVVGFTNGASTLTCLVTLAGDQIANNNQQVLSFFNQASATAIPFVEAFDPSGVPTLWSILNPDSGLTWELDNVIGVSGTSTNAMTVNHYSYTTTGEEDVLQTEIFDMTNGSVGTLTFDVAKAQYSATLGDGLRVEVSADCGATYQSIYQKSGTTLATVGNQSNNWSPGTASHWRNESVDLSAYLPNKLIFRFISENGYGNGTFIDNINVTSNVGIDEQGNVDFNLYPNPSTGLVNINITNELSDNATITLTNQLGQSLKVISADLKSGNGFTIDLANFERGIYLITVNLDGKVSTKRIVKN
jgi:hypothetical protein